MLNQSSHVRTNAERTTRESCRPFLAASRECNPPAHSFDVALSVALCSAFVYRDQSRYDAGEEHEDRGGGGVDGNSKHGLVSIWQAYMYPESTVSFSHSVFVVFDTHL